MDDEVGLMIVPRLDCNDNTSPLNSSTPTAPLSIHELLKPGATPLQTSDVALNNSFFYDEEFSVPFDAHLAEKQMQMLDSADILALLKRQQNVQDSDGMQSSEEISELRDEQLFPAALGASSDSLGQSQDESIGSSLGPSARWSDIPCDKEHYTLLFDKAQLSCDSASNGRFMSWQSDNVNVRSELVDNRRDEPSTPTNATQNTNWANVAALENKTQPLMTWRGLKAAQKDVHTADLPVTSVSATNSPTVAKVDCDNNNCFGNESGDDLYSKRASATLFELFQRLKSSDRGSLKDSQSSEAVRELLGTWSMSWASAEPEKGKVAVNSDEKAKEFATCRRRISAVPSSEIANLRMPRSKSWSPRNKTPASLPFKNLYDGSVRGSIFYSSQTFPDMDFVLNTDWLPLGDMKVEGSDKIRKNALNKNESCCSSVSSGIGTDSSRSPYFSNLTLFSPQLSTDGELTTTKRIRSSRLPRISRLPSPSSDQPPQKPPRLSSVQKNGNSRIPVRSTSPLKHCLNPVSNHKVSSACAAVNKHVSESEVKPPNTAVQKDSSQQIEDVSANNSEESGSRKSVSFNEDINYKSPDATPHCSPVHESKSSEQHKLSLLQEVLQACQALYAHFHSARDLRGRQMLGSTVECPELGHVVLTSLCSALNTFLSAGLKPRLDHDVNNVWQLACASAVPGVSTQKFHTLVCDLKQLSFLSSSWLKFNAFVFGLLNQAALGDWLVHLQKSQSLLEKYYSQSSDALLPNLTQSSVLSQSFLYVVQSASSLATLPFRLEYDFEFRTLENNNSQRQLADYFVDKHIGKAPKQRPNQLEFEKEKRCVDDDLTPLAEKEESSGLLHRVSRRFMKLASPVSQSLMTAERRSKSSDQLSNRSNLPVLQRESKSLQNNSGEAASNEQLNTEDSGIDFQRTLRQESTEFPHSEADPHRKRIKIADNNRKRWSEPEPILDKHATEPKTDNSRRRWRLMQIFDRMMADNKNQSSDMLMVHARVKYIATKPGQLGFEKGAKMQVLGEQGSDWLMCKLGSSQGLVPVSCVTPV